MAKSQAAKKSGFSKVAGWVLSVLGVAMLVGGIAAWFAITAQLKGENMIVPEDAPSNGGKVVAGPLTAWSMQEIIEIHANHATDGLTYADLGPLVDEAKAEFGDDSEEAAALQGQRNLQQTASFLRGTLLTSVLSYGVALLAMGTGLGFFVAGLAILKRKDDDEVDVNVKLAS